MVRTLIFSLVMFAASREAFACSCLLENAYLNEEFVRETLQEADAVVHARVTGVGLLGSASVEVIDLFKGSVGLKRLKPLRGSSAACGNSFQAGDRAIFLVYHGVVSLCGRLNADPQVLEAFRKLAKPVKP